MIERPDSYILTFTDQQNLYQQLSGDYSAAGLLIAKRDINEGGAVFLNRLGRKFNREYRTGSLTATQQYYQFPSEVLRISEIQCKQGSTWYTPQLVSDEAAWNALNFSVVTSNFPTHYFIRGFNEVGLYPIPSVTVANGIQISYEPQHIDLTQDDFVTGALTVNNGSLAVTHSASGFSQQMVGRYLQVTDGSDGKWYRIGSYSSNAVLNLENYYEGISGSGRTFRIGEIMKIPNGYQDAPIYYALERYYLIQSDSRTAPGYASRFEAKLKSAKQAYGRSTSRMGSKIGTSNSMSRTPFTNLNAPIIYPF